MDLLRRLRESGATGPGPPPDIRILFVHIPKTAGMSLYHALERWASPSRSIRFPNGGQADIDTWLALPEDHVRALRLISGHLRLHDFRRRDMTGWSPITLLRDPVARTLSTYTYIRGQRKHPWHRLVASMDLDAFLDWFEARPANRDQQCDFISRERTAEAAIRVLSEEFLLAGAVERLDAFDEALARSLGTTIRIPILNRSGRPIDPATITAATLQRIRSMHPEDAELHRLVVDAGLVGTGAVGDRARSSRSPRPMAS